MQTDLVRDLILRIVQVVVDTRGAVTVDAINENHLTLYRVSVASAEVGQIIGKQGRTARSLRTILAAIAMKEKRRIELDIAEMRR